MARHNPQPPPLAGCNLLLFNWQFQTLGEIQEVTLAYKSNAPDGGVGAAMVAIIRWHLVTNIAAWQGTLTGDTTLLQCFCADLTPGINPTQFNAPDTPVVGTVDGHSLPAETTAVVEKYSVLKGQHGRGRMEHPAVPISFTTPATNPNVLNAAGEAAYNTLWNIIIGAVTSGGTSYSPCLFARANPEATPPITQYNLAILLSEYTVRENLGTQRRRYPGRGI